jgi:hypothetical protein
MVMRKTKSLSIVITLAFGLVLANNWIAATRLANNMIFANMEAFKTTIQQTRDNTKELSRINVNTARSLEQASRDTAMNVEQDASTSYSRGYKEREEGRF